MTCPMTEVYVFCDFDDIPCEYYSFHRTVGVASSCGKQEAAIVYAWK
jgi:hypothetical protein